MLEMPLPVSFPTLSQGDSTCFYANASITPVHFTIAPCSWVSVSMSSRRKTNVLKSCPNPAHLILALFSPK